MSVFDSNNRVDHTSVSSFLDPTGGPTIQRYDTLKYKQFDQLTDKQLGFFWRPEEVDIYQDAKDFKSLTEHEQHIFTSNLKRQILLDSVQGRAPAEAFGSIVSLPELENWIITWTFSETIHSRSYTHIIRNIYSNPSKIFDEMLNVKEIVYCAD
jgi:ribonucleoside-diphosphate reductase beta chain